jgi:hypothetical protein
VLRQNKMIPERALLTASIAYTYNQASLYLTTLDNRA